MQYFRRIAQSKFFLYKTFIFQIIILKDKFHYKISKIGNIFLKKSNDFLKTQF